MTVTAIAYLTRLCRRWGGSLETVPHEVFEHQVYSRGWSRHPSLAHAIDVADRRILAISGKEDPGALIHERGARVLERG